MLTKTGLRSAETLRGHRAPELGHTGGGALGPPPLEKAQRAQDPPGLARRRGPAREGPEASHQLCHCGVLRVGLGRVGIPVPVRDHLPGRHEHTAGRRTPGGVRVVLGRQRSVRRAEAKGHQRITGTSGTRPKRRGAMPHREALELNFQQPESLLLHSSKAPGKGDTLFKSKPRWAPV